MYVSVNFVIGVIKCRLFVVLVGCDVCCFLVCGILRLGVFEVEVFVILDDGTV